MTVRVGAASNGVICTLATADAPRSELHVRYYEADDSVIVNGEYLIRGVAGRILWLLLTLHDAEGRSTFINRELRHHPFLKLPAYRDNLESRLHNLRRRLDEKGVPIRIEREQRGRLRLACQARPKLERVAA